MHGTVRVKIFLFIALPFSVYQYPGACQSYGQDDVVFPRSFLRLLSKFALCVVVLLRLTGRQSNHQNLAYKIRALKNSYNMTQLSSGTAFRNILIHFSLVLHFI